MNYSDGGVEYIRFNNKNIRVVHGFNRGRRFKNLRKKWFELPYAGETQRPEGIDPYAGSWPLNYLNRNKRGVFITQDGKPIKFDVRCPNEIDFCKELRKVQKALNNITIQQRDIAEFWGDGPATKQWTPIIDRLVDTYKFSPAQSARVLACVHAGINDAFVVAWYLKYLWEVPRPCQLDYDLITAICTPKFPAYPSGHSVISGTAEVILSYFFPTEAERLKELSEENSISRLYGGVHFPIDLSEGLKLGRQIGEIIVGILKSQRDKNNVPIDTPSKQPLYANLNPPPYTQAIPFTPRARLCDLPLLPEVE